MKIVEVNDFDNEISKGTTFVDFYADWCGPCKMMGPIVEEVEQEMPTVKFIKINVDKAEELAARFGIMSIPSFFLFKDGQLANKIVGGRSKQEIIDFINK